MRCSWEINHFGPYRCIVKEKITFWSDYDSVTFRGCYLISDKEHIQSVHRAINFKALKALIVKLIEIHIFSKSDIDVNGLIRCIREIHFDI